MQDQLLLAQSSLPLVREVTGQSLAGFCDLYIGLKLTRQSGKLTLVVTIDPVAVYTQTQFPGQFTVTATVSAQRWSDIS